MIEENDVPNISPPYCLLFILTMPVVFLLRAAALVCLWGWFVVPLGVIPVGMAHAIGISFVAKYLSGKDTKVPKIKKGLTESDVLKESFWLVAMPGLGLALGWVVHMVMML